MRLSHVMLLGGALVVGCAAKPQAAVERQVPPQEIDYDRASVAALVFDPPISMNEMPLDLDRGSREAGAFVGYEQSNTTYFYVRSDDRWPDRYERRAISE